jgi:hypothetical protein
MTIETKTTIQLSDLTTVEFECKNCHAIGSWPIDVAKNPPTGCPCRTDLPWMAHGGQQFAQIVDLIALVQKLGKADKELFVLRFVLKTPPGSVAQKL